MPPVLLGHLDASAVGLHDASVWWRRPLEDEEVVSWLRALGIMLMRIDAKLERVVEALEDDGWEEEEEAD